MGLFGAITDLSEELEEINAGVINFVGLDAEGVPKLMVVASNQPELIKRIQRVVKRYEAGSERQKAGE